MNMFIKWISFVGLFCLVNASQDNHRKQLVNSLKKYVETHHKGDYIVAFKYFDKNKDNHIDRLELNLALKQIGVGNMFTRTRWVNGIMNLMDIKPEDDVLSFDELIVASFDQAIHTNKI